MRDNQGGSSYWGGPRQGNTPVWKPTLDVFNPAPPGTHDYEPDGFLHAFRIMRDSSLRETSIRRTYWRAFAFTPERMIRGYLTLYFNLVSGRSVRRGPLGSTAAAEVRRLSV
jgi:hypothetical protein